MTIDMARGYVQTFYYSIGHRNPPVQDRDFWANRMMQQGVSVTLDEMITSPEMAQKMAKEASE
jgi:hypothetical protein